VQPAEVDATTSLHRVTVFVTYRCNLRCPYCKTIARGADDLRQRPQRAASFDLAQFERLLASHGRTPIAHLHFTGGEASLHRDLAAMISAAKAHGVGCVSLTSNGTQAPAVYEELVRAGLDEIRISLDSAHTQALAGGALEPEASSAAIATVRALGGMRRAGGPFFLIVNTVVERSSRQHLPELVRFLLALGPDDIKLITSVDEKEDLGTFTGMRDVVERIERLLAEATAVEAAGGAAAPGSEARRERFPLLRQKLGTVFAADAIGLEHVQPAPDGVWRCYVPLTERTVDGVYYYPCSVYLREGGAPLGRIDEPQERQRQQTAAFVARGDCLADPICRRYCLHCTRAFNERANDARALAEAPG